jgi:hypothetical protein
MTSETNGRPGPHPGVNDPSGVSRVLITGYYDGATDGLLQFGDAGPVFAFELTGDEGESPQPERSYSLRPMPADALDRFADAVAPHLRPGWPVWFPQWSFPSDGDERVARERTDAVLAAAGPVEWTVRTADFIRFATFLAEPSVVRT